MGLLHHFTDDGSIQTFDGLVPRAEPLTTLAIQHKGNSPGCSTALTPDSSHFWNLSGLRTQASVYS